MTEVNDIYMSLDEAREEIKRRWNDLELRKKVEDELGDKFMPMFREQPRGISFRQVCSPDNGFTFFYQMTKYIGAKPLVLEYHDDIFTHLNEEKKGLGRLRVMLEDGMRNTLDIMDFHAAEKQKLGDIVIKTGEKLVDFHHNLFNVLGYDEIDLYENSKWFHGIGRAADYYYYLLLHFMAHGVLFETFSLDGREKGESKFVDSIIAINIEKIKKNFGFNPIIVRSYPENQNDNEDFYWWCYPPSVNDYIVKYANDNKLNLKINK